MTHPENFISHPDDPHVYMTDYSDLLPFSRFPVRWGFKDLGLYETLAGSFAAVEQIPGFSESKDLEIIQSSLKSILVKHKLLSRGIKKGLVGASSVAELFKVYYKSIILPVRARIDLEYGRLPDELEPGSDFEGGYDAIPASRELIFEKIRGLTFERKILTFNPRKSILELKHYPKPESADSFPYYIRLIKSGVLLNIFRQGALEKRIKIKDFFNARLLEYFREYLGDHVGDEKLRGENPDLVWQYSEVYGELSTNKYAVDIKKALSTSPEEAVEFLRNMFRPYLGNGQMLFTKVKYGLMEEIDYLNSIRPYSPHAEQSIEIAKQRLDELNGLNVLEFIEKYLQSHTDYIGLFFLPYHQVDKLKKSPHNQGALKKYIFPFIRK